MENDELIYTHWYGKILDMQSVGPLEMVIISKSNISSYDYSVRIIGVEHPAYVQLIGQERYTNESWLKSTLALPIAIGTRWQNAGNQIWEVTCVKEDSIDVVDVESGAKFIGVGKSFLAFARSLDSKAKIVLAKQPSKIEEI